MRYLHKFASFPQSRRKVGARISAWWLFKSSFTKGSLTQTFPPITLSDFRVKYESSLRLQSETPRRSNILPTNFLLSPNTYQELESKVIKNYLLPSTSLSKHIPLIPINNLISKRLSDHIMLKAVNFCKWC